ncbi:putative uncharacterized protein DDB_G0291608 [Wyeomyia smithii]|uniref:putative uncharacterized protein DDB_G0291608 n=1 Tax=Wyeomyia smithii TaxID=174621 RepID=UPI002468045F|nr:putative uncharacterized protein DDB_G0291608 [Wyeomyia smithii]
MFLLGFVIWACVLSQVSTEPDTPPNRPTDLEDIERDNLKTERHLAFKKEALQPQQQQLQPQQQQQLSYHSPTASSSQNNNHYSLQIEHHPGGAINYVTPLPSGPGIVYAKENRSPQYQQKVPQVHEDHSTYTVPARQSLIQPIIGGSAPAHSYLTPQPQYVYVQAQPQQQTQPQPQSNHQQQQPQQQQQPYGNLNLPQSLLHILPQNQQAYIMIPTNYYQQQPHSAQQYAAYVNDPENHVETYSHGESGPSSPPQQSDNRPPAPEPPTKTHGVVYAAPSSTPTPFRHQSPSAEFSVVKSVEPPVYLSPNNQLHTTIHYSHSPARPAIQIHHETQTSYPSLTHPNNGILNYLGLQQKQPLSLLDSYVPSSLQLSPIKAIPYPTKSFPAIHPNHYHRHYPEYTFQHYHHYQPPQIFYQPSYPTSHSTYPVYQTPPQSTAASVPFPVVAPYNTIAYSVPLTHTKTVSQFKRSPMLETMSGVKYSSPRAVTTGASGAITKLQPAGKLT